MNSIPAIAASFTFLLMLLAYRFHSVRAFHIPVMASIIVFDLCMPIYLYNTGNWYERLIEQEDILSFLIWAHFGLILTLYTFYTLQIHSAIQLLKKNDSARNDHAALAKGILVTRALVILSGWLLTD